jgi:RNA polymerase sigma factor (sigma-70 family)
VEEIDVTIVAERPLIRTISAGLAEEIERQEREDNARGPEPENLGRRATRSYTAPARVDLRTADDRPLTTAQTERVRLLAAEHGDHLVRYIAKRLGGAAYWAEAQDIAQDVWVAVTRGRLPQLLQDDDEYAWPRLAAAAKFQALEASRMDRRRESAPKDMEAWLRVAASAEDQTECVVLALLEPADGESWAPGCYADAIAALSPRQREILELRCREGMTQEAIAARLEISRRAVQLTLQAAVRSLSTHGQDVTTLPEGWERVVDRLPSQVQRDIVRLCASGVSQREAARRLGIGRGWLVTLYRRAVQALREMVADHRMDPVQPTTPTRPSGCSRPCATGCALRRGTEVSA